MVFVKDKVYFSIIIPTYNNEKTILRAIESVINQKVSYEIIIINDGSTDKTKSVVRKIRNSNIKLINIHNHGVSHARNIGIKEACGKYLIFLDADDFLEKNYLEYIESQEEKDMFISNYYISKNKKIINKEVCQKGCILKKDMFYQKLPQLLENYTFNMLANKVFKRKIIIDNNILFDEEITFAEDLNFNLDYIKHALSYSLLNIYAYTYTINSCSLSRRYINNKYNQLVKVNRNLESFCHNEKVLSKIKIRSFYSSIFNVLLKNDSVKEKKKEIKKIRKQEKNKLFPCYNFKYFVLNFIYCYCPNELFFYICCLGYKIKNKY